MKNVKDIPIISALLAAATTATAAAQVPPATQDPATDALTQTVEVRGVRDAAMRPRGTVYFAPFNEAETAKDPASLVTAPSGWTPLFH